MSATEAGSIPVRSFQKATRFRTLLAFTGVAPLGAFVIVHLVTTATALFGVARFDRVFAASDVLTTATIFFVVLPLLFHAAYGTWVLLARPWSVQLPAWWPRTRRLASFVALVFVLAHVGELALRRWGGAIRAQSLFDVTASHLSSTAWGVPLVAVGYLVGIAAVLFHFATSLWTFLTTWGVVVARRRALAWGLGGGAALLFLVGTNTVIYFATGTRLLGPAAPKYVPDGPPPPRCATQP